MRSLADSEKNDLINKIVISMWDEIGEQAAKRLQAMLYVSLSGYELTKISTELTIYDENNAADYLRKFLIAKKIKGCTDRTLHFYGTSLKKIFDTIGKSPMDIQADDIRVYIANRQIKENVSLTSINNEIRNLSSFYQWMQNEEIRTKNPMNKIEQIKVYKKQKEAFTDMEIEKMRGKIQDNRTRAIFELLLSSWCRVSEIAQIRLCEIDGDRILVHGKGKKDRYAYMNARALFAVKEYLQERKDPNPYLFPKMVPFLEAAAKRKIKKQNEFKYWYQDSELVEKENHTDKGTIEKIVRDLGRSVGVAAHPHKFRRTGATFALRAGMPIEQVSKILGHANLSVTQVYLDLHEEDIRNAHEKYVR